jgi:hypothetical protein
MKPHKHAEVIKAFADGIECEFFGDASNRWLNIDTFNTFDYCDKVRIKPEPKPDVVKYITATNYDSIYNVTNSKWDLDNVKLTFDGETGKLKSAEVIK